MSNDHINFEEEAPTLNKIGRNSKGGAYKRTRTYSYRSLSSHYKLILLLFCVSLIGFSWYYQSYYRFELALKDGMRDPGSVELRNIVLASNYNFSGLFCTEIQGKNALGAYVGFSRAIASLDGSAWLVGEGFLRGEGAPFSGSGSNGAMLYIDYLKIKDEEKKGGPTEASVFETRWQALCKTPT